MILYEDSRAGAVKVYGLHALVKQCVCERLQRDPRTLADEDFKANPRNGASNVLKTCERDLPKLADSWDCVFAVYDADKAHELVRLPREACIRDVLRKLTREPAARLRIALLDSNLEAVLTTLQQIDPGLGSKEDWDRAILRKKPYERDLILNRAAKPNRADLRRDLCGAMKSFGRLVERLEELFRGGAASPPA